MQQVQQDGLVPTWWTHPENAPANAEGVRGYQEACVVGVPDILTTGDGDRRGVNIPQVGRWMGAQFSGAVSHLWTIPPAVAAEEGHLQQPAQPQTPFSSLFSIEKKRSESVGGGGGGLCLLSSQRVFLGGALDLFNSDLAADNEEEEGKNRQTQRQLLTQAAHSEGQGHNVMSEGAVAEGVPSSTITNDKPFIRSGWWSIQPAEASQFSLPLSSSLSLPLSPGEISQEEERSMGGMDPFLFMRPFSAHINRYPTTPIPHPP